MDDQTPPSTPSTANERFFRHFQQATNDLQDQIQRIEANHAPGSERADAIEHCLSGIARLSNEVKDISSSLPAYDQRSYSEAIKALNLKLQKVRSSAAPKPRFSFKSKPIFSATKNESAISLGDASELSNQKLRPSPNYHSSLSTESSFVNSPVDPVSPASEADDADDKSHDHVPKNDQPEPQDQPSDTARTRQPSFSQSQSVTITHHNNIHVILPLSASHATSSCVVSHLRRAVIDMSLPTKINNGFAGLTLKDIDSSLIICGRVDGAAHLTNVHRSVIVVASRQFRMHASSDCDVYLLIPSRPIIEDCTAIRFAPLPERYLSDRDSSIQNEWSSVDDFKWLRNDHSPNWSVLDQSETLPDAAWETVLGGPNIGVNDILTAVKVPT